MPESWFVAERELQAVDAHRALPADLLRLGDLVERRTGRADGKEQLGVGLPTQGTVTPSLFGLTEGET